MFRISALERVDDSGNLLKEKLSRLSKLRWPLAWLVVCRNPIDVDLNFTVDLGTVLVSEHCIGRGMEFWGSEI